MESLYLKTTPKKNANVLQHMMGYFKEQLSADEKKELLEVIDHYRQEYIPLIVPITLIQHYVRKYDQPYLKEQVYLESSSFRTTITKSRLIILLTYDALQCLIDIRILKHKTLV